MFLFVSVLVLRKTELVAYFKWASTRENLSSGVTEQQRRRSACAFRQSDQRIYYSRIGKYHVYTCSVSVADEQAGVNLTLWETPKTGFVALRPNCGYCCRVVVCVLCLFLVVPWVYNVTVVLRIHHEWIEKSVPRITNWHSE